MFYYPIVLHRHSGCFSTIWLAATRGIRVTRREFLKVNVKRTCRDILNYVTAQVPPAQPNQPKPRFSLYLSSQLQYGVVVVYHRQCGFLLEEVQQTIDRLLRAKKCARIDMAEPDRLALNLPNNLDMMEEAEGAPDPFFGLMASHQLISPYKIHQTAFVIEEAGSQHSLVPSSHTTPDKQGFRSPPAAITLREKEQFVIYNAEHFEGDDLPEATAKEIDLLMDQSDLFCRDVEEERKREKTREREGAMSSIDQLKETAAGSEQESVCLLDEESGQPAKGPLAAVALEMTPPQVAMPTPPLGSSGKRGRRVEKKPCEEVVECPVRKPGGSRRRQLVFADAQVQISDRTMKEQVTNPLAETLELSQLLMDLPSLTSRATASQLFSAPCGPLYHTDLQSLWKESALLRVIPTHGEKQKGEVEEKEQEETRERSEQDREILRTERRQSNMKERSFGLQLAEGSSLLDMIQDASKEDKSISDVITPVGRWSPQDEAQPPMEPIAEENIEMPEVQIDSESKDMLSWITASLQRFAVFTFNSLLPPEADRTTAAHTLYKLLELLSTRQVTAQQTEPYGVITVTAAALRVTA